MPLAPNAMADPKKELRATLLARRRAIPEETRASAAGEAAEIFLDAVRPPAGEPVSGYWPMRGELDPRPLMTRLAGRGHPLLLPAVAGTVTSEVKPAQPGVSSLQASNWASPGGQGQSTVW